MRIAIAHINGRGQLSTRLFDKPLVEIGLDGQGRPCFDRELESDGARRVGLVYRHFSGEVRFRAEDAAGPVQLDGTGPLEQGREAGLNPGAALTIKDGPVLQVAWSTSEISLREDTELLASKGFFPLSFHDDVAEEFQHFERIGEGAHAEVWRCKSRYAARWKAIKVLRYIVTTETLPTSAMAEQQRLLERFRREGALLAELGRRKAPNIARVHRTGFADSLCAGYLVMEYIDGVPLGTIVTRDHPIEGTRIARWLHQIAVALEFAHNLAWIDGEAGEKRRGVIHRDLRPGNVLVRRRNDRAVLCDFGVAGIQEGGERLTMTQQRVSNALYTPPEAFAQNIVTPALDLWGLAVTAWFCLSGGRLPYIGANERQIFLAIRENRLVPMESWRKDSPPELLELARAGLSSDPAKRPILKTWISTLKLLGGDETEMGEVTDQPDRDD